MGRGQGWDLAVANGQRGGMAALEAHRGGAWPALLQARGQCWATGLPGLDIGLLIGLWRRMVCRGLSRDGHCTGSARMHDLLAHVGALVGALGVCGHGAWGPWHGVHGGPHCLPFYHGLFSNHGLYCNHENVATTFL